MYPTSTAVMIMVRRFVSAAFIAGISFALLNSSVVAQSDDQPVDAVAVFNQAQDLHEKGDLEGAIKLYEKALKIVPEFPEAEYQRGNAYLALGKTDQAESAYRRAIELRPDWTLAKVALGSLLVQKASYAEAQKLLQGVLSSEPQNPPALTAMIDLKLRTSATQGELRDLLARITPLTSKANPTAAFWNARAAVESALGMRSEAKSSLAKALAVDPKNRNALFQFADIAVAEADIVKASDILSRLEVNSIPRPDALKLLAANVFALEGKFVEALSQLDAIAVPTAAAANLRKRITATSSTDVVALEKQLENDGRNAAILGRLCSLYRRVDPEKALAYCRRASDAEPGNVTHAVGFGAALVQAKQFDAAVGILRKIVDLVPDNTTAHANLATALFQLKRYTEAKEQFLWLVSAQPRSAGAYLFLGIVHDQLNEYMDAAANYQQYLRLADPAANELDIDKVNLRLPQLQKLIKEGKGKK